MKQKSALENSSKILLIVISVFVLMLTAVVAYSLYKPVKGTYSATLGYCYLCDGEYVWGTNLKDCDLVERDVTEDECGENGAACPSGYFRNELGVCTPNDALGTCYSCNHKLIWSTILKDCDAIKKDVPSSSCAVGNCESGYIKNSVGDCVRDVKGYYVTFKANGGKFSNNSEEKKQPYTFSLADDRYHADYPTPNPTYTNRTFLGWTFGKASECSDTNKIYGGIYHPDIHAARWTDINNTRTYFACWKVDRYIVTFDKNGGVFSGSAASSIEKKCENIDSYGRCIVTDSDISVSWALGTKKFTGWGTTPSCTTGKTGTLVVTGDTRFFACWTNVSSSSSSSSSSSKPSSSSSSKPSSSSSSKSSSSSSSKSSSNAKYSVILNVNGGTWSYSGSSKTVEFTDKYYFPSVSKNNCSLNGWCVGSTSCSSPLHEYVDSNENGKTVYASWNCNSSSSSSSSKSSSSSSKPSSSSSKPSGSVPDPSTSLPKPSNGSNIDDNPQTGLVGTFIAWGIGILSLMVSFYYFRKNSSVDY